MDDMVKSSSDENRAITTHTKNDKRGSFGRRASPEREESIETREVEGY
jgi:hypothetical protein